MKVTNANIIACMTSKKGSQLVSIFRDSQHLVDNCVLVNPTNKEVKVNTRVDGDMIFNNSGLNTFIVTDIKN